MHMNGYSKGNNKNKSMHLIVRKKYALEAHWMGRDKNMIIDIFLHILLRVRSKFPSPAFDSKSPSWSNSDVETRK